MPNVRLVNYVEDLKFKYDDIVIQIANLTNENQEKV